MQSSLFGETNTAVDRFTEMLDPELTSSYDPIIHMDLVSRSNFPKTRETSNNVGQLKKEIISWENKNYSPRKFHSTKFFLP
jgi:hypothetical protein